MTAWIFVLTTILMNTCANIFMKLLTTRPPLSFSRDGLLAVLQNPYAYLAVTCYGLALVSFTFALSRLDLSTAYTCMVSGAIILVTILSILFFNEPLTLYKVAGIGLILSGVFLIYRS